VQGIPGATQAGVCVRDDGPGLAAAVIERLAPDVPSADDGRRLVLERYAWQTQVDVVAELLLRSAPARPDAVAARSAYAVS
jgi:hypothetical protein